MNSPYKGPDRRMPRPPPDTQHLEMWVESKVNDHLDEAIEKLQERISKEMEAQKTHISREMEAQKVFIKTAFPEGDMHGHMLAHKDMIKLAADRAERWNKLWDRILVGGGYSLAAAVALALWETFKDAIKK